MNITEKLALIKEIVDQTMQEFEQYSIEHQHTARVAAQIAATKMLRKVQNK